MNSTVHKGVTQTWRQSPQLVRVVPFAIFLGLTCCQGLFGEGSRYWIYAAKTLIGAWLIWAAQPFIPEMRWRFSPEACAVGVLVFGLWVGLDSVYPSSESLVKLLLCPVLRHIGLADWCATPPAPAAPWNPHAQFGPGLAWGFVGLRLLGSAVIVPPLEEVFYRSFLYRYVINPDFEKVPLNAFRWGSFLITAALFGLAHYEWLPGILCGMLYQGLVIRTNRLGDAMTAHGITNLLLGLWIVWKGAWHFW